MAMRGRPRKNGVRPGWMAGRFLLVLHGYDVARARGEKYIAAIQAAMDAVRDWYPEMPISATEVKRILAEFRSPDLETTFLVSYREVEGVEAERYLLLSEYCKKVLTVGIKDAGLLGDSKPVPHRIRTLQIRVGPNPTYVRHNAKARQEPL